MIIGARGKSARERCSMVTLREQVIALSNDPKRGQPSLTTVFRDANELSSAARPPAAAVLPSASAARGMAKYAVAVFALDLLIVAGALVIAKVIRFGDMSVFLVGGREIFSATSYSMVALALAAVWLFTLAIQGSYRRRSFGVGLDEYKRVLLSTVVAAGVVSIVCYLGKIEIARGYLAIAFPVGAAGLLLGRAVSRKWLHRQRGKGRLVHRVLVVGDRAHVAELVTVLRREAYLGFAVAGACLPDFEDDFEPNENIPILGRLRDVARAAHTAGADTVAVTAVSGADPAFLRRLAWSLEGMGVELLVVPSLTDVAGPRIAIHPVAGLPLLRVREPEFTGPSRFAKSAFDRLGALLLLVLTSPLLIATALAIKLEDGGPAFFRQVRIGTNGREFRCWKFRSMVIGADQLIDELRPLNDGGDVLFKMRDDPRVTRVGRWLRRSSLDEVPQLINVLRGQMSMVGPRPPLPEEVNEYGHDVRRRLLVKPGMTGLWQVSGRSDLSWSDSVRLDLYYVENWSFFGDLLILAKTLRAVSRGRGAY